MRVLAQTVLDPYNNHPYEMLIPNNAARTWATYVLKKLRISKQYVSRRQGFYQTGDPGYMARYIGTITEEQHRSLMTTYIPYAPPGLQYSCPTCS